MGIHHLSALQGIGFVVGRAVGSRGMTFSVVTLNGVAFRVTRRTGIDADHFEWTWPYYNETLRH